MRSLTLAAVATSLSLGACATVEAPSRIATVASPFMPVGARVDPPRGYSDMCRIRTRLCNDAAPGVMMAALTAPPEAAGATEVASAAPTGGAVTLFRIGANTWSSDTASLAPPAMLQKSTWTAQAPALDDKWSVPAVNVGQALAERTLMTAEPPASTLTPEAAPAAPAAPLTLDQRLKMLQRINLYVNAHVLQRTDVQIYGVEEYWTRSGVGPGAQGDCEDIATEKREELIDEGFPAEDLFYAVAYRRDIGLHAVLLAHTEVGDLVLDSRSSKLSPWNKVDYTWVKRQISGPGRPWALVDPGDGRPSDLRMAALDANTTAGADGGAR